MRATSLWVIAAIAARNKGVRRRWDFVAAYLQGDLEAGDVVHCRAPPGYEAVGSDRRAQVCKVTKSIYGMAQVGRCWQRSLFPLLQQLGFTQCLSDSCVSLPNAWSMAIRSGLSLSVTLMISSPCTPTTDRVALRVLHF
eukprot:6201053-Pleurochrysis_carterae.AAC.2